MPHSYNFNEKNAVCMQIQKMKYFINVVKLYSTMSRMLNCNKCFYTKEGLMHSLVSTKKNKNKNKSKIQIQRCIDGLT